MRRYSPSVFLLLILSLLLTTGYAHATAGFAEYSWYFHDRAGQWIEWHHGDICPPEAARKNCILIRKSKTSETQPSSPQPTPYDDSPRNLYWPTILALLPSLLAGHGLAQLWRRRRQRKTDPGGWSLRSVVHLVIMTVVGLALTPNALAVLFPASPSVDGWHIVIGLSFNILIAVAPFTLWWTYCRLFPPPGRTRPRFWQRALLWLALLPSSVLAPLLLWGPPNLLLFSLPTALLPKMIVSLLVVWAASKVKYRLLNISR